ncbi:MAG: hypothetical protein RL417_1674 [Pseudomonadota bacterium]
MQTISWLAFFSHSALSRAVVHFFPFSSTVSAPYGTECRLTVFGGGLPTRAVTLEGARLGQPDGVKLEEAFPELASTSDGRLVGLQIDLESVQSRVDLSASGCVVELLRSESGGRGALRFRPALVEISGRTRDARAPLIASRDRFQTTSLIVVNRSGESFTPELRVRSASARPWDGGVTPTPLQSSMIVHDGVEEITLDGGVWEEATRQECSWGESASRAVELGEPPLGAAFFAVYREPESKRPVCVSAL